CDIAWSRQTFPGRSRGWFPRSSFDEQHAAGIDCSREMSRALDCDRPAARRRRALFWLDAQPAHEPTGERHPFAACRDPRPYLERRDRRGTDGEPAPWRAVARDFDFAALRARADLRCRGGQRWARFLGALRNAISDSLCAYPDRHRRRAIRGGFCIAANRHVSGTGTGKCWGMAKAVKHDLKKKLLTFCDPALEGPHENTAAHPLPLRRIDHG